MCPLTTIEIENIVTNEYKVYSIDFESKVIGKQTTDILTSLNRYFVCTKKYASFRKKKTTRETLYKTKFS